MPTFVWSINNATSATGNDLVWGAWNNITTATSSTATYTITGPVDYAAEAARAQASAARARDPLGLRRTPYEQAADRAHARALAVLCEHLTREQIVELMTEERFHVRSPRGRVYRIGLGFARNVRELDAAGQPVAVYCAHPADANEIPACDTMLVQKLMLENHEEEFLRIANRTALPLAA